MAQQPEEILAQRFDTFKKLVVDFIRYLEQVELSVSENQSIDYTKAKHFIKNFIESIYIPNRTLKALILHDMKDVVNACNLSLFLYDTTGIQSEDLSTILAIRKLKFFLKLVGLSTYSPGENSGPQVLSLMDMFLSLGNFFTEVTPEKGKTYQISYFGRNYLDSKVILNTNITGLLVNEYPELVFAIHTILLNMFERGAAKIDLFLREFSEHFTITIADDISSDTLSSDITIIQRKIDEEPSVKADTAELIPEGGLTLSGSLLRGATCKMICRKSPPGTNTVKYFQIIVPKGNVPLAIFADSEES